MSTYQERIDTVRKYFQSLKANRYPFVNETLAEKDEYTKSLYFRLLCALVRYTCEPNQMQVLYIERLIAGCKAEQKYRDYMRMALELEIKDVEEFVSALKETELKYYFCIDGSILLMLADSDDKNYELLAEIVEIFGITRQEVQYLALASRAIVAQNSTMFEETLAQSPESMFSLSLFPYIADFHTGLVSNTDQKVYLYSFSKAKVDLSNYQHLKPNKLVIENIILDHKDKMLQFQGYHEIVLRRCSVNLSELKLQFENISNVVLERCVFDGGAKEKETKSAIKFNHCTDVSITGCVFKDFSSRTIEKNYVKNFSVENTSFENCIYKFTNDSYEWRSTPCVIYIKNDCENSIHFFENCTFVNCGGKNTAYAYGSNFICNCKSKLKNCQFTECWNYYTLSGKLVKDPDNYNRRMFPSDTKVENCQVVNSANIT